MRLKINFTLKTGVEGEVPVLAILNFGYKEFDTSKQKNVYKPLKYYTGVKVNKSDWNQQSKLPNQKSKQVELLGMEKRINEIFNYLSANGTITNEILKAELDEKLKGKAIETIKRVRITEFIQTEILTCTSLKKRTKENYSTLSNKLISFEKKIGKLIYSSDFNEDLYLLFMEEVRKDLGRQNSVWKVFKDLRATIKRIVKKYKIQLFVPTQKLSATEKIKSVNEEKVYLDFAQIQKIIDYKPHDETLKNTKILLMTLLFTGCRYSDVDKITIENVYDKGGISFRYARFFTHKGDKEVIIPILKPLKDAIEQNGGKMGIKPSELVFNANVKDLVKESGIKDQVTMSFSDSYGKKQFETKPFNEFVSSHTGRRSFVTNLINHVPVTMLTKITSHELKDSSIIFGYNKISLLENAVQFVRELARLRKTHKEHFIFDLV
ncbi:MAG: tyrosine-type recombinase/integrase [Bacteroidetes bacterium]|nr:tyrosine-type recombinase/integrase [Bacteroidota bacterium]